MRNYWLLSRALKDGINYMMDFYFRGRAFDSVSQITDIYNQKKYGVFEQVIKKYGPINLNVDMIVMQENDGKYWVQEIKIKRT